MILDSLVNEEASLNNSRKALDECNNLLEVHRKRVEALKKIAELWEA